MKSLRARAQIAASDYEAVAKEYYDKGRHPTCHNFNFLSRRYIANVLADPPHASRLIEVGCGASSIAPILHDRGKSLGNLTLTDASAPMLQYSRQWEPSGALLKVARAEALREPDSSFAVLVAGLGDPYNTSTFWAEVTRVLEPNGQVIFTTPSFEWASRYRQLSEKTPLDRAQFELSNGRIVYVPSVIPPLDAQVRMMQIAGLRVTDFQGLSAKDLGDESVSPKIRVVGQNVSIIWGFLAHKPSGSIPMVFQP